MLIAQILNGRVHNIFEAPEIPNWPPDPEGNPIVLVDLTGKVASVGDGYNPKKKTIVPYPAPEERPDFYPVVAWDNIAYKFNVEYRELPPLDPGESQE